VSWPEFEPSTSQIRVSSGSYCSVSNQIWLEDDNIKVQIIYKLQERQTDVRYLDTQRYHVMQQQAGGDHNGKYNNAHQKNPTR
jgi:hypothetical protein